MNEHVREAMRSGEWLRTQWIVRVVYDLGATPIKDVPEWAKKVASVKACLRSLEASGAVERRDATEHKSGDLGGTTVEYGVPRDEWKLTESTWTRVSHLADAQGESFHPPGPPRDLRKWTIWPCRVCGDLLGRCDHDDREEVLVEEVKRV